jgi:biotin carboxyl carrier protein
MKMEIEIRARAAGRVSWVTDADDGEDVDEGVLAAVLEPLDDRGAKL